MKARRSLLLLSTLVLALVGAGSLAVWKAKQQYALDRQLIAALVHNDNKAAFALVNAGADPNTRYQATPTPTLPQLLRQLLHRSPLPTNHSSTAFLLACGKLPTVRTIKDLMAYHPPDDALLVRTMLAHGADIRSTDEDGRTALHYAIEWKHPFSEQVLLDYGANVNAPDQDGMTPLIKAAARSDVDTVRHLLEHGASVMLTDQGGNTALYCAVNAHANIRIVRLLMAQGANPNARNSFGDTPLLSALRQKRSDIVRLLREKR